MRNGNAEEVLALLEAGADVHARTSFGDTPLHQAALGPILAVITGLIEAGADVNATDRDGRTPLYQATRFWKTLNALIVAGADVNAQDKRG